MKITHKSDLPLLKGLLIVLLLSHGTGVMAQRLNPFLSETSQAANGSGVEVLPYENMFSLFDGMPVTSSANARELQFYMLMPGDVTELGIRLIAPAPSYYQAFPGDVVTPYFENKEYDQTRNIDPDLLLEYALYDDSTTVFVPGKKIIAWVDAGAKSVYDESFATDSKGSQAVVKRSVRKWSTELIRLTIRDKKGKKPSGSFLLQTGTVPALKGIRLKTSIDALRSE